MKIFFPKEPTCSLISVLTWLIRDSLIFVKIGSGESKRLFVVLVSPSMNLESSVSSKLVNSCNYAKNIMLRGLRQARKWLSSGVAQGKVNLPKAATTTAHRQHWPRVPGKDKAGNSWIYWVFEGCPGAAGERAVWHSTCFGSKDMALKRQRCPSGCWQGDLCSLLMSLGRHTSAWVTAQCPDRITKPSAHHL